MQKRRVGTISMAIILIAFGVLIFVSQINKVSAVELAIKFWPAILFLLGGEILWFSYKYKGEDVKIKYDVLSVFIVILIVFVNIAIYGLIETGVMNKINHMVLAQTFNYQMPYNEIAVNDNIKKIVINTPNSSNITVRTEDTRKIVSTASLNIVTTSEEKAKKLLNNEYILANESGNTLYISFANTSTYNNGVYDIQAYDFKLIIPEDKEVEINGGNDLHLIVDKIKADWIIDNVDNSKIRLGKGIDVKIKAYVFDRVALRGNVKWDTRELEDEINGELIYGEGKNSISIFNSNGVVVDESE